MDLVTLEQVRAAQETIATVSIQTPLEASRVLSEIAGAEVFLKCENLQRTGAFKIRGAYNRISRLDPGERERGVVAASAGNHAQGVALAASLLGVRATVFMPEGAALPKIEATRKYGAEVILQGAVYDEAEEAADRFASEKSAILVHPFEHPDVIAGQGTIALEILEQLPEVKTLVVPVGGGGLISGIASAAKALRGDLRIVGVEPAGAPGMSSSLEKGAVVTLETVSTVADGLAAKKVGEYTLQHVMKLVDDVVSVSDDEIAEALLLMAERAKLVVEPAGAVGVAALMSNKTELQPPVVVLLSGGNIDPLVLMRVISFGMGAAGRYFAFRTYLGDKPGELHRLLGVIADSGCNILHIEHHRVGIRLRHLGEVEVAVQVETRGRDHIDTLIRNLRMTDYPLERL